MPYLGTPIERLEDASLLTGRGRYADDLGTKPGTLHAAVLRSPHAHADIVSIDFTKALAAPGVRSVFTGADAKAWAAPFVVGVKQPMEHWCIAVERVRYVGEPVAVVVAEDRYATEDALDLVQHGFRNAGSSRTRCSWRSLILSSRSPSAVNFGLPRCFLRRALA